MRNDMTVMTARKHGDCAKCGEPIIRGQEIIWIPATRKAMHYNCGEKDFLAAQAEVQDEDLYSQHS